MTATQDWHIDLAMHLAEPLTADDAFTLTEQLADTHAAIALTPDGHRLEISMTITTTTALAAATRARALVYALELAQIDTIEALEVRSDAERTRQLNTPTIPALVGNTEIGELAGVSRQQVFNLARQPGFPPVVQRLSGQNLRRRDAVVHWLRSTGRVPDAGAHQFAAGA